MDNILNNDLNYDDILINEASKPFFLIQKFKKNLERTNEKKELIFILLSKFKG